MNIFFDLYPIIRSLYSTKYDVVLSSKLEVASSIINACAHYRQYFRSLGVETTIYLIAGYNCPKINNNFCPDYNRAMVNRLASRAIMNSYMKTNLKTLQLICPYLPDIHYIYTNFETSVCIAGLIDMLQASGDTATNLVISKDSYPLQLPMICKDTVYLRPKKSFENGDTSYIIIDPISDNAERELFWRGYYMDRGTENYDPRVHPTNISLISTLSSFPRRSISLTMQITRAVNMLLKMGNIQNCSVRAVYTEYEKEMIKRNISLELLQNRFKALDIPFQLESFYKQSGELEAMKFENRIDPNAIQLINDNYFKDNPLDLGRL